MSQFGHPWPARGHTLLPICLACLAIWLAIPERAPAQSQRITATVSVRVSDEHEVPLEGAEVRLYPQGFGSYASRAFSHGGMAEFGAVVRGAYEVEALKQGYETARIEIDVAPGANQTFSFNLRKMPDEAPARAPGGTVSATALGVPGGARKEFEVGVAALEKNPGSSIGHFQKAIHEYPKYSEAYAWLGIAYMQEKRNGDAQEAVQKAISLDPKLSLAYTVLGKLYLQEGKFSQAEPELLQSIQLDPQSWDAPFELARCYFNMGKLDKSLQYARQASAAPQASPVTHLLLVDIYLRQGDKKDALEELQTFAKVAPENPLIPRVKQRIEQLSKPN